MQDLVRDSHNAVRQFGKRLRSSAPEISEAGKPVGSIEKTVKSVSHMKFMCESSLGVFEPPLLQ